MEMPGNVRPSASTDVEVVCAATLKDAYRQVQARFGQDAVIIGSRSVKRRQALGLGLEKMVEVSVHTGPLPISQPRRAFSPSAARNHYQMKASPDSAEDNQLAAVERQVANLEKIVTTLTEQQQRRRQGHTAFQNSPLARTLLQSGCSAETTLRLLTRFSGETGQDAGNLGVVLPWLSDQLRASNSGWDGFFGCHAFLGPAGSGRTNLVLDAAARLQKMGRRTLVLATMPRHGGEIRRLQIEASEHGYDAAIIQKEEQLPRSESHFSQYEVVLVDLPALDHSSLQQGAPLHSWLANNAGFHRHLVIPLDMDRSEMAELAIVGRSWNVDWSAITRLDRVSKPGRLLDLTELIPLPLSLVEEGKGDSARVEIANSSALLDRILQAGGLDSRQEIAAPGVQE